MNDEEYRERQIEALERIAKSLENLDKKGIVVYREE